MTKLKEGPQCFCQRYLHKAKLQNLLNIEKCWWDDTRFIRVLKLMLDKKYVSRRISKSGNTASSMPLEEKTW